MSNRNSLGEPNSFTVLVGVCGADSSPVAPALPVCPLADSAVEPAPCPVPLPAPLLAPVPARCPLPLAPAPVLPRPLWLPCVVWLPLDCWVEPVPPESPNPLPEGKLAAAPPSALLESWPEETAASPVDSAP